ncbi:MAG: hypothetical protein M3Q75_09700, partial [Gemmatimonadota bacterium]|nr:hypothetical protein [Gemmatimonadota bacterium]
LSPEELEEKVRELYPFLVIYLNEAEIGPILRQAAEESWSAARLEGAVQGTQWWANHNDAQRKWEYLKATNPGEYKRQVDARMFELYRQSIQVLGFQDVSPTDLRGIAEQSLANVWTMEQSLQVIQQQHNFVSRSDSERQFIVQAMYQPAELAASISEQSYSLEAVASQVGVTLSDDDLASLATNSYRHGWSPEQIRQAMLGRIEWGTDDQLFGEAAQALEQVQGISGAYMLNLSDSASRNWARQIVAGNMDAAGFLEYAQRMASSRHPNAAAAIARGVSLEDYVEPYRQLIAQTYELSPESVDFTDPQFAFVLDGATDPQSGERGMLSLSEAATYLRSQEAYKGTEAFSKQAADLNEFLLKSFGQVG